MECYLPIIKNKRKETFNSYYLSISIEWKIADYFSLPIAFILFLSLSLSTSIRVKTEPVLEISIDRLPPPRSTSRYSGLFLRGSLTNRKERTKRNKVQRVAVRRSLCEGDLAFRHAHERCLSSNKPRSTLFTTQRQDSISQRRPVAQPCPMAGQTNRRVRKRGKKGR